MAKSCETMVRDGAGHGGAEKPRKRFSSWKQPGRPTSPDDAMESRPSSRASSDQMTRRERLNAIRCVDLDQYRQDFRARKFAGLTIEDKLRMFGTPVMPIFVPLAKGETLEMYEQRFREWLWREHGDDLDEVQRDANPFRERSHRIAFANANAHGDIMFDPHRVSYTPESRKRERSASRDRDHSYSRAKRGASDAGDPRRDSSSRIHDDTRDGKRSSKSKPQSPPNEPVKQPRPIRICDYEEPKGNATSTVILRAHLACGCTTCLFAAMGKMDKKLVEIDTKHTPENTAAQVIDLT